ncbi:hypothetical protein PAHAL_2G189800 [Panicum hallii]|jgi:hypothetical protein|uniref:Uncharacterized protein n=1 Tax=Panicum hallii TaxID=206008 RepID=A0A2T8KPJ3_9POAL|nr:hypothetical protein PAHAL_2G189800 [Panicum hallii]
MTDEQKDIINKRGQEAYHARKKAQPMSAEQKSEKVKQTKRAYRRRIKDIRSNTLHHDSITMENPKFEPKLIFLSDKQLNAREIPIINGTSI